MNGRLELAELETLEQEIDSHAVSEEELARLIDETQGLEKVMRASQAKAPALRNEEFFNLSILKQIETEAQESASTEKAGTEKKSAPFLGQIVAWFFRPEAAVAFAALAILAVAGFALFGNKAPEESDSYYAKVETVKAGPNMWAGEQKIAGASVLWTEGLDYIPVYHAQVDRVNLKSEDIWAGKVQSAGANVLWTEGLNYISPDEDLGIIPNA